METIVAAVIGAAATIAAVIYAERQRSTGRRLQLQADRYGLRTDSVATSVKVLDLDGNAVYTKTTWGLRASSDFDIPSIPDRIWLAAPGGMIRGNPRLKMLSAFPKPLEVVSRIAEPNRREVEITVEGSITRRDPPLDFALETDLAHPFVMTAEEAENAYRTDRFKAEYWVTHVEVPTEEIEVEVEFPEGYEVELFSGVFFGHSEFLHPLETERIKGALRKTARGGRLLVPQPLIGFRYFVYWFPPPRRRVQELRAMGLPAIAKGGAETMLPRAEGPRGLR